MDGKLDPIAELRRVRDALKSRGSELAAIGELPPRKFAEATRWIPEAKHCGMPQWTVDVKALRRLTLNRQSRIMARIADRIDAALRREKRGLGLPSDWKELLAEARRFLRE
jgi:hypothetical protein